MKFRDTIYDIDKDGNVLNTKLDKYITPVKKKTGYYEIRIGHNNKRMSLSHHRSVWEAWNGTIPIGMHVNHINENKADNRLCNLEIVTPSENQRKRTLACGEQINTSKATDKIVREIRSSQKRTIDLMKDYGLSRSTIDRIKSRTTWKHIN
jgi:hypothetical protein